MLRADGGRTVKMALAAMQEWEESDGEKNSVGDA